MAEIEESAKNITSRVAPDANVIFGASIDPELEDKVKITVIATGFDPNKSQFYSSFKKSIPTQQESLDTETKTHIDPALKNLVPDEDLPEGIEIEDEFDIPAFLRKNN